jgi:hypothetical protein
MISAIFLGFDDPGFARSEGSADSVFGLSDTLKVATVISGGADRAVPENRTAATPSNLIHESLKADTIPQDRQKRFFVAAL